MQAFANHSTIGADGKLGEMERYFESWKLEYLNSICNFKF